MANKFKEHDSVKVVRLTKTTRGLTGTQPRVGDHGAVVSGTGSLLGMYLVESSDVDGRAVWIAEFDEGELEMDLTGSEAQELIKKATDQGLEIAQKLIKNNDKTASSAIVLGTAAGALYWTLEQMPGYEQDSKNWLETFFRVLSSGLKTKGIQLDIQWARRNK